MAGGFHLRLFSETSESQAYSIQALAAAIDRDARLLSLRIDTPDASDEARPAYPPLDHLLEAALDVPSLAAMDAANACCLLPERSAVPEADAIRHERTLRSLAARNRLATFDQSVWGRLRIELGVAPRLLVAPALPSEPRPEKTRNVVIFVNDHVLGISALGDVTAQIESILDGANVIVKDNRWHGRLSGSEWLAPEVRDALCHVHLGAPFAGQAHGRMIDSVACLLPVVLFGDEAATGDSSPADVPPPPCPLHEIHFMKVATMAQFGSCFSELIHDVALRAQLATNAALLSREYNAQAVRRTLSFMLGERPEALQ
jgi:hypothetical protein